MVKLGWALTAYLGLSFAIFLVTSNTLIGWIFYVFLLLPFYGLVLAGWWAFVWKHRTQGARIRFWIWSVVLALQIATILTSPGNCYGVKQGARCYSNLQILLGDTPATGPSYSPHWQFVENIFPALLAAYSITLVLGLLQTKRTLV